MDQIKEYAKLTYSVHFMGLNSGKLQIYSRRLPFSKDKNPPKEKCM